jgi:hypothetical protein
METKFTLPNMSCGDFSCLLNRTEVLQGLSKQLRCNGTPFLPFAQNRMSADGLNPRLAAYIPMKTLDGHHQVSGTVPPKGGLQ